MLVGTRLLSSLQQRLGCLTVGRGASSTGVAVRGCQVTGISRAAAEAGTAGGWGQEEI